MLHHVVIVAKDFLRHDVAMSTKPTRASTAHIVPFGLRLQPELKARLEESAKKEGRSLNAEIAARLESSFYSEEGMPMLILHRCAKSYANLPQRRNTKNKAELTHTSTKPPSGAVFHFRLAFAGLFHSWTSTWQLAITSQSFPVTTS
jgi:hypothetical protein